MENGPDLRPVELKSGRHSNRMPLKALTKWLSFAGQDAENASICYGENESFIRSGVTVVPWEHVDDLMDE